MMERHPKDESEWTLVVQDSDGWQQGQERVLRYLKALGVPPVQSLELANETMKRAAEQSARDKDNRQHPTRVAMRLLGRVLSENDLSSVSAIETDRYRRSEAAFRACPISSQWLSPQLSKALPVMPDLKRGHMLPEMQSPSLLRGLFAFLSSRKNGSSQDRPKA